MHRQASPSRRSAGSPWAAAALTGLALAVALPAAAQSPPPILMDEDFDDLLAPEGPAPTKAPPKPRDAAPALDPSAAPDAGPALIAEEYELDRDDLVIFAAKSQTTIQQVPGIVTVVTADEMRAFGHRTINEVLQTVPGFEGDRYGSNGWTQEPLTRGNPRTILVLWNGVPLNEPARNIAVLNRKLPMEIVQRLEITSGPGGVLWGSNALLGVVNIITQDAAGLLRRAPGDHSGEVPTLQVTVGRGDGPGEQDAVEASLSFAQLFWERRIRLYTNAHYFGSLGGELSMDHRKLLGVLPAPEADGPTYFETDPATGEYRGGTTDANQADRFFLWSGRLEGGPLRIDWMLPWEEEHRQIATGGALLVDSETDPRLVEPLETTSDDKISALSVTYSDRFLGDRLGVALKGYHLWWTLHEDPFGVFPASSVLPQGRAIELAGEHDQLRRGLNLDADLKLPRGHHLLFGGEVFEEVVEGLNQSSVDTVCERSRLETGEVHRSYDDVPYRSGDEACVFTEPIVFDSSRRVGALFVTVQSQLHERLGVFLGGRLQLSDSYDTTLLSSASLIYNPAERLYVKLNYSEGMRPPYFTATRVNSLAHSGVTYQANEDLVAESSQSLDSEVNVTLFEGSRYVDRLFLRANYGYTLLSDLINNPGGRFQNSGSREIHTVEALARVRLLERIDLWTSFTYLQVMDSQTGPVRNIANRFGNAGLLLSFLDRQLELSSLLTWVGPREDFNRDPGLGRSGDDFIPDTRYVDPTDLVVDRLDAFVLWRVGLRYKGILDTFDASAYVYDLANLLGAERRRDPDLFFDDRVLTRPQPREGWSFFIKLQATL